VYPAEVEDVIDQLDEVSHCAVIGVPDETWGEVGLALVLLRSDTRLDVAKVLAHCRERLAHYKTPRHIVFVDALPLNAQGKVLKKELRRIYVEDGAFSPSRVA